MLFFRFLMNFSTLSLGRGRGRARGKGKGKGRVNVCQRETSISSNQQINHFTTDYLRFSNTRFSQIIFLPIFLTSYPLLTAPIDYFVILFLLLF